MRFIIYVVVGALLAGVAWPSAALARGFGAAVRGGVAVGPRGAAAGSSRVNVAAGPYGAHASGAQKRSYVGPGGTTVQTGRAAGVTTGPYGGVHASEARGTRVTTPSGRTYTSGERGGVTARPAGGVTVRGARGAVATGPYGGVAVGGSRAVAVGHSTHYVSATAMRTSAVAVRTGFVQPYFTSAWFRARPTAWVAPHWIVPSIWLAPAWPVVSTYVGVAAPPVAYDYGSTVVIENNTVYVNGAQAGSAEQYAQQATQFAEQGRQAKPAQDETWQPLGVFGMIQGEEKIANHIFQLAVNKAGVVRGNYYDAIADNTLPVYGSVDPKSQRVAWSIGDKKDIVFEAGLNNLTQPQTTLLVHYGKERSQQMILVHLQEPDAKK